MQRNGHINIIFEVGQDVLTKKSSQSLPTRTRQRLTNQRLNLKWQKRNYWFDKYGFYPHLPQGIGGLRLVLATAPAQSAARVIDLVQKLTFSTPFKHYFLW